MNMNSFKNYFNVVYLTKNGRSVVAQRVMGITAHEAKRKIELEMMASPEFDRVLVAVKLGRQFF